MYMFMSFSLAARNQGVMIVKAKDGNNAVLQVIKVLGHYPKCDDTRMWPLDEAQFIEQDLTLNRLYSKEELVKLQFQNTADSRPAE